ncbi:hypothetical protein [Flavobacterium fluviatile]|uniref:hypothetical protein n=1 Tax=Flavobacterium fluviatile TaxID=1862387 RepID=UPI0013D31A8B|nr:hypothetical protein [Flavobacterium fluviatile]
MSSIIANSVLNIIATFSDEDMQVFCDAFDKMRKPKAKTKPKNMKPVFIKPTVQDCIEIIKAKYSTPKQVNLHNSLDVPLTVNSVSGSERS